MNESRNQDVSKNRITRGRYASFFAERVSIGGNALPFFQRNGYWLAGFLTVFIVFLALYSYSQNQPSGFIYWFDDWIFYADSRGSYSHMKDISFKGNMWRHPLYPVVVYPLLTGIKAGFGLGTRQAAKGVIALIAALNVSLFFILIHSCLKERISALLFTGLYGVLFSNLVFFSIPETYSLANVGILVFFLLGIRFNAKLSISRAIILGLVSGLGALVNPPLGLLLFSVYILCVRGSSFRQGVMLCLWATLVSLFIYLGTNFLLFGLDYIENSRRLATRWATISNFLSPTSWLNVAVSFFVYGVISPIQELQRSIGLKDMGGYFRSPVTLLVFSVFVFYLGFTAIRVVHRRKDGLILMAVAWLVAVSVFHVYFNPREALLYSCQALAPFMLILGRVFGDMAWKWKSLGLAIFLMGLAYINFRCLQG